MVLVVGPEHRRYFDDAGWSKDDIRAYMHPRITADNDERPGKRVGIRPDGLLLVAAGGAGMGEAWVLFPHLNWAVSKRVVVGIPRDEPTERQRRGGT